MAEEIILHEDEKKLFNVINDCVTRLHDHYRENKNLNDDEFEKIYNEMSKKAYELHKKLKKRGYPPKHHKYMIKNRKVPIDTQEFYNHIHPVEDLIAFIKDPDANNDPEDTTIGVSFKFNIFTRRWGHYDSYIFIRTKTGWNITGGIVKKQECDKNGKPGLFKALRNDSINYPNMLAYYLGAIWNSASNGADKDSVQRALSKLAEWVSYCEQTSPSIDILEGII